MSRPADKRAISVEVVYATPNRQAVVGLQLAPGSTVEDAVMRSGLGTQFEDFKVDDSMLGIFSRKVGPAEVLRDGDRVEIYRPLVADPKEVRRQRALSQSES